MDHQETILWSFLVKSETKYEIADSPKTDVTPDEFATVFRSKVSENEVPALVYVLDVDWDNTGTLQRMLLVTYAGDAAPRNVLQFSVALNQMGRFYYIEKRTHIMPPEQVSVREKKPLIPLSTKDIGDISPETDEVARRLRSRAALLVVLGTFMILAICGYGPIAGVAVRVSDGLELMSSVAPRSALLLGLLAMAASGIGAAIGVALIIWGAVSHTRAKQLIREVVETQN